MGLVAMGRWAWALGPNGALKALEEFKAFQHRIHEGASGKNIKQPNAWENHDRWKGEAKEDMFSYQRQSGPKQ